MFKALYSITGSSCNGHGCPPIGPPGAILLDKGGHGNFSSDIKELT
jgi:hypothetical protein